MSIFTNAVFFSLKTEPDYTVGELLNALSQTFKDKNSIKMPLAQDDNIFAPFDYAETRKWVNADISQKGEVTYHLTESGQEQVAKITAASCDSCEKRAAGNCRQGKPALTV